MTDNEIIKALEFCAMRGKREVCGKCPYYNTICCEEHLLVDSVLLINRQKAEIAIYQEHIDQDIIYARSIRAEAIKEFAERLKEDCPDKLLVIHFDAIDNLVKEMVGDE